MCPPHFLGPVWTGDWDLDLDLTRILIKLQAWINTKLWDFSLAVVKFVLIWLTSRSWVLLTCSPYVVLLVPKCEVKLFLLVSNFFGIKKLVFSIMFAIILTLLTISTIFLYIKIYFRISSDSNIMSKAILEHPRRGKMKKVCEYLDNCQALVQILVPTGPQVE